MADQEVVAEYNIIWVDDTPAWVGSVRESIEEFVAEAGLHAKIDLRPDGEGLVEAAQSPQIDLLIIDHNLHGDNGEVLVSKIRESGTLTEVIFYSQDVQARDVIGVVSGVFHCQRQDFEDLAKRVIQLTLRKMQDLTVIRGLAIGMAIDLEVKLEQLITSRFGANAELFREKVFDRDLLDFAKKSAFLLSVVNDSLDKAAGAAKEKLKVIRDILAAFDKDIIDQRNILAHSKKEIKDNKTILKGLNKRTKQIEINLTWLSKFREDLWKHRKNLGELESVFSDSN